jgi:two-component system phosphate regulon sensor histidine kinase PhoR
MNSWSLRWRILTETVLLVAVTAVAATLFDVLGAVVVGVLAAITAAFRAHQLSSQFSRMTEGVLRTASIDRSYRINPEGPAEMSRMARAVNRLADRLVAAMRATDAERTRLVAILQTMAEGVMLVDEDGMVEFANPAALKLLGPEGKYRPGARLITLNNSYDLNQISMLPARSGMSDMAELEIRASQSFVQVIASPVDDRDGRRKSVVILTDISALRQTETTRREFVSNASHELRTPIAAIRAAAETLQRGAGDDPEVRQDFLDRILEDSVRIEQMVQEMLELSRLESGQTPLHLASIDPAKFLSEVTARFQPLAEKARSKIRVEAEEGLTPLRVDPVKFEQVLTNLITNSLNAMPDGGTVVLSVRPEGDRLLFKVTDNGHGVLPAHLPHLFERFYKVDSSRSKGGSGLGLAISRHIVQIHDGEISAASRAGAGTTISILMPCADRLDQTIP